MAKVRLWYGDLDISECTPLGYTEHSKECVMDVPTAVRLFGRLADAITGATGYSSLTLLDGMIASPPTEIHIYHHIVVDIGSGPDPGEQQPTWKIEDYLPAPPVDNVVQFRPKQAV